jgi:hypothetical protein
VDLNPVLTFAFFVIGIVVGLTGMRGPAVSSQLVASAIVKPVGSFVHLRRGTVRLGLVKWLSMGEVVNG